MHQHPILASSPRARPLLWWPLLLLLLTGLSSCAARDHRLADEEGARIGAEKLAEVDRFRSEHLLDPEDIDASPSPGEAPIELPEVLDLDTALVIATDLNRSYKAQRESLFLNALDLGLTRRDFLRPVFSGRASFSASDGSDQDYQEVAGLSLGGSQVLFSGGRISVDASTSLLHTVDRSLPSQSTDGSISVSVTQPLIRGAGPQLAFESLTQAERNLLYRARDFELFRQNFFIGIIDKYYGLISQQKQLANTRENIAGQRFAWEQAKALFRLGRGSSLDVFRAEQALLEAQNSALNSEQAFQLALDNFKIDLGLPIDVEFSLQDEFPEVTPFQMELESALAAALNNRLDLLTTRDRLEDAERRLAVAENSLLPSLDLSLNYSSDADSKVGFNELAIDDSSDYAVGLVMEIPFDRKSQRNGFRAAEIALEQAKRDLENRKDVIILEVRDSLRTLEQRRMQIELGIKKIQSVSFTVEKSEIEQLRGTGTNRDVVEAKNSLTDAKNDQLDRIVAHETQLLRLQNQIGMLFVTEEGTVKE